MRQILIDSIKPGLLFIFYMTMQQCYALDHYINVSIVYSHKSDSGLFNQQMTHFSAFTLSAVLSSLESKKGNDEYALVLHLFMPPAKHRMDEASYSKGLSHTRFVHGPVSWLHDLPSLQMFLKSSYDISVHDSHTFDRYVANRNVAKVRHKLPYGCNYQIEAEAIAREIRNISSANVEVYLEGLFMSCHNDDQSKKIMLDVSNHFLFHPFLRSVARQIIGNIKHPFNGIHLRTEMDVVQATRHSSNDIMSSYVEGLQRFRDSNLPCYVASGSLSEIETHQLQLLKYCSRIIVKSLFKLDTFQLLTSEMMAAVEFMVLLSAEKLVGHYMSSFSFYLEEWRFRLYSNISHPTYMVKWSHHHAHREQSQFHVFYSTI